MDRLLVCLEMVALWHRTIKDISLYWRMAKCRFKTKMSLTLAIKKFPCALDFVRFVDVLVHLNHHMQTYRWLFFFRLIIIIEHLRGGSPFSAIMNYVIKFRFARVGMFEDLWLLFLFLDRQHIVEQFYLFPCFNV